MKETILKIYSLLEFTEEKNFTLIISLTLVLLLIETLSIGLVVPIFAAITDDNFLSNIPILGVFANKFFPDNWFAESNRLIFSKTQIIVTCAFIVILVYLTKIFASLLIYWKINGYISNLKLKISKKFFNGYINLPYVYHLKSETAVLHNNLNRIYELGDTVESLFIMISELLIALGLLTLLFYSDFYSTIILILLYPSAIFLMTLLVRKTHKNLAKRSYHHTYKRIKFINDAFRSIKEIKILGKTKSFIENFSHDTEKQVGIIRKEKIMQLIPRYSYEILFISSLFIIIFIFNFQNKNNFQMVPMLALFAAAGLRLMPSVTKITNHFHNLIRLSPFIDIIYKDYQDFSKLNTESGKKKILSFENDIYLKNVEFSFENNSKKVLKDINMKIASGSHIGLIGSSGSGKTTLVDLIMGLVSPTNGTIEINNHSLGEIDIRSWQNKVGYVPQNIYLTNDSIRNNIAYGIPNDDIDDKKLKQAAEKAELLEFIEGSESGINTIIGEGGKRISGGQQQRIGIARALYHNPNILILDESTNSLDENTEKKILNTVQKLKGKLTTIIISHNKNVLKDCEKIFEIKNGTLIKE